MHETPHIVMGITSFYFPQPCLGVHLLLFVYLSYDSMIRKSCQCADQHTPWVEDACLQCSTLSIKIINFSYLHDFLSFLCEYHLFKFLQRFSWNRVVLKLIPLRSAYSDQLCYYMPILNFEVRSHVAPSFSVSPQKKCEMSFSQQ